MKDQVLMPSEVAQALGIPVKTLAHWRTNRVGPTPLRLGRHVRYLASEVDKWVESQNAAAQKWMAN